MDHDVTTSIDFLSQLRRPDDSARREQNELALGGMRHPRKALDRLPRARQDYDEL